MSAVSRLKSIVAAKRKAKKGGPEYLFDEDIETFALEMASLAPQSYGSRICGYLGSRLGYVLSDNPDRGNLMKPDRSEYIEVMGSILTGDDAKLNLVQIRKWQLIDAYFVYCWDFRDIDLPMLEHFMIPGSLMPYELMRTRARAAHGSSMVVNANRYNERSLRLEIDGPQFKSWSKKFGFYGLWDKEEDYNITAEYQRGLD